jgi:AcrR family transcriptional regulator
LSMEKRDDIQPAQKSLRRTPRQERSRERVGEILKAAMALVGEKGIDAVAMKEIAAASAMPLATVYHYFPNKTAIIATLYEAYSKEISSFLELELATISGPYDILMATERVVDHLVFRLKGDPAIQDLLNAIQADKALHNIDLEQTRLQAAMFCRLTQVHVAENFREDFERSAHLLFQLAGSAVRLALIMPPGDEARTIVDFKRLIRSQLLQFGLGEPAPK